MKTIVEEVIWICCESCNSKICRQDDIERIKELNFRNKCVVCGKYVCSRPTCRIQLTLGGEQWSENCICYDHFDHKARDILDKLMTSLAL